MAGTPWVARRFPVRIGRATESHLRSEEAGVWERHAILESDLARGFLLKAQGEALVRVNGQTVPESALRNGDLIELGSLKLQFWLAPAVQTRLRFGEIVAWSTIVLVTAGQVALLYYLLR